MEEKVKHHKINQYIDLSFLVGPEHVQSEEVEICLKTLQEKVTGSLPPLNWAGILSPLMKLPFSKYRSSLKIEIRCHKCFNGFTNGFCKCLTCFSSRSFSVACYFLLVLTL